MEILVLDTIHGGRELAGALEGMGHSVEVIDVYRAKERPSREHYDLLVAPVHLDPENYALGVTATRRITHHEAVAWALWDCVPHPMVEVTGAQGKTTTAHAMAHLMHGRGVLHTSMGTFGYPDRKLLWRSSITPASVIRAARAAWEMNGWLVAEVSLGVTGIGDLAVLTSPKDYTIAGGKKRALDAKLEALTRAPLALLPPELEATHEHGIHADALTRVEGESCCFAWGGREGAYTNPLLLLQGYRLPLRLATAAALLLGIDPSPLGRFRALEGRMSVRREGNLVIVDNANSGTNRETTLEAARHARRIAGCDEITLVIGEERRAVCEGFPRGEVLGTIEEVRPAHVVLVGISVETKGFKSASTLEEGLEMARGLTERGSIVLAVKTWR